MGDADPYKARVENREMRGKGPVRPHRGQSGQKFPAAGAPAARYAPPGQTAAGVFSRAQAAQPPSTSETSSKPCWRSRLAAMEER